jgi:uracil-DNA glycosylase
MKFEYSAGAFVYVKERGKTLVLFLARPKDYDLPKGHIEKGESAELAAHRELREETGMDVQFAPYFVERNRYFFRKGKDTILKQNKFFLGKAKTRKVRISKEHTGYEWLDYDGIMEKVRYRDVRLLMPRLFDYIDRRERMEKLNAEYARLPGKTAGWGLSRKLVRGDGPLDAKAVLLGEAPGAREDEQGRPFVGRSGNLLGRVLKESGLRREDFYVTSVVQFRPPENRLPKGKEIDACRGFLAGQMAIVKPRMVVLLGRTASAAVLGLDKMATIHGKTKEKDGITYFITYHPAAALRSTTNLKRMTEDFKRLKRLLTAK